MRRGGFAIAVIGAMLAVLAVAGTAAAAQRYATPTGTAAANSGCIEANPCDIFAAMDLVYAGVGDEVILQPGTYNVSQQVYLGSYSVHGTGKPEQTRIVSSFGGFSVAMGSSLAQLSDVQIESPASVATINASYGSVRRVVAINNGYGAACSAYYGTISDSVCLAAAATSTSGFALAVNTPSDNPSPVLRNVTAISRSASGSGIAVLASGGAVANVDAKSVIAHGYATDVTATVAGLSTASVVLDHSNFATHAESGGGTVTLPTLNSNQTAAPAFVDAANGDFREAAGSPTIDAGAVDFSSGATDLAGNARALDAAADIGAFEYVKSVSPPAGTTPDTTAPKIKVAKKPKSKTTSTVAKFSFSANEPATFTCKFDKRRTKSCKSPYSLKVKIGSHRLKITAKDAAGNGSSTTIKWKVVRK